jgi:hypothetical protein
MLRVSAQEARIGCRPCCGYRHKKPALVVGHAAAIGTRSPHWLSAMLRLSAQEARISCWPCCGYRHKKPALAISHAAAIVEGSLDFLLAMPLPSVKGAAVVGSHAAALRISRFPIGLWKT